MTTPSSRDKIGLKSKPIERLQALGEALFLANLMIEMVNCAALSFPPVSRSPLLSFVEGSHSLGSGPLLSCPNRSSSLSFSATRMYNLLIFTDIHSSTPPRNDESFQNSQFFDNLPVQI